MKRSKPPTPDQVLSARTKANLTQPEAAEVIEVSKRQWQKYEAGAANMHPVLFRYFCIVHNLIEVKP